MAPRLIASIARSPQSGWGASARKGAEVECDPDETPNPLKHPLDFLSLFKGQGCSRRSIEMSSRRGRQAIGGRLAQLVRALP